MVEGLLCSSASRSAVVAGGRPCWEDEQGPAQLSLRLEVLLPQAQRQRRKYLLESEEETQETKEQFEKVVNFWSTSRWLRHQLCPQLEHEPPEYFISHVWQPGDQVSPYDYAEEKVSLLKQWAIKSKALVPEDRSFRTPWFLKEEEEDQQKALVDPENSWRTMRCWMDKACAHRGFGADGAPPQEAVRATKVALANCEHFVAIIGHAGYFQRLWCCVEWAFFLARAAPKYRDLEILLPDALHQPQAWHHLVHAAANFRVEDLRSTGAAFSCELHRELQEMAVDMDGFEGFMRATSLALLTLHALLEQGEGCAAFGNAAFLESAVEACEACGLRGLGKVLATAQPMLWWRSAYQQMRRQYEERHYSGATDLGVGSGSKSKEGVASDDPLEMLVKFVNKTWFRKATPEGETEQDGKLKAKEDQEEGEEEEILEHDSVVDPESIEPAPVVMPPVLSLTSLGETAEALLKQGITELPTEVDEAATECHKSEGSEVKEAPEPPQCTPQEAAAYAIRACEAEAAKMARAQRLEMDFMDDMASWNLNFKRQPTKKEIKEAPQEDAAAGHEEGGHCDEVRGEVESTAWKKILVRSGVGLPDGFLDFWHAVHGEKLSAEGKAHARLFFQSWAIYHRRVCKWFDTYVVPFLEVWRQRGIRTRGIIEEAFSESFLRVGGSVYEDLCQQLREEDVKVPHKDHAVEPMVAEPWENPCVERLLAIQRKETTFLAGEDQDRSMLPAILVSCLPLRLGKEPQAAVLCARPLDGAGAAFRRACVAQKLGSEGLSNGVYQLLTNFTSQGCTTGGLELEVIFPRLLLQVRGSHSEVVCGMRARGSLNEKEDGPVPERSGHVPWTTSAEEASDCLSGSGSSSAAADTRDETNIDWSPWVLRIPPEEVEEDRPKGCPRGSPRRAPKCGKGPRATIDLQLIEHGVIGASLRPRKWWKEPTAAAERLLPLGAQTLPQKLPLIGQQRFWQPRVDLERGVQRSWQVAGAPNSDRGTKAPCPALTIDFPKAAPVDPFQELPKSARVKMLKSLDCYKLKDSRWTWRCLVEGGPKAPDEEPQLEERCGSLLEHFERLYKELKGTCFAEWVTLGACTQGQERPMKTGNYAGGGGALLPPPRVTGQLPKNEVEGGNDVFGGASENPLDASSPCPRCQQRALTLVPLKGSMMSVIWEVEACTVCLRCGFSSTDPSLRAEMLQGDKILEVTTSFLLRPGDGDLLQRSVARVLRVENNCCSVAMLQANGRAESRVATMSFSLAAVTTAAAATVVHRPSKLDPREERCRPFASDESWITNGLADTGLDLHFDRMRIYSVELAIQELDDKRMLRIRKEVSPIVMWLEMVYLLSADFSLIRWNRALAQVFGTVTLTAAVLMRMNINRLREVVGAGPIPMEELDDDAVAAPPVQMWPVKLHRVLVARESSWEDTLGVAMRGAGLLDGGLSALKKMGEQRQMEHFAGVDDQFQQELAASKQDVEKTSTSTAMAILAKTRSNFGSNSRALLQARRILKRKQVFLFLRDLYTNIVDHKESAWLREDQDEEPEGSEGGSSHSAEEDIVLDEDDEDLRIHAPREARERLDETSKPQTGLTIIKVLGHFSEYVHFSQMALMSIKVLGVMIRAALRVRNNANSITVRHESKQSRTTNIEQAMLTNNFMSSALRALYRHPTDQSICRETLLLLVYMVNEGAEHQEQSQAKMQLLQPPERPFTLLLTISKLSSLDDRNNLLLCLQIFLTISTFPVPLAAPSPASPAPERSRPRSPSASLGVASRRPSRRTSRRSSKAQFQTGVRLEPSREPEAAQILVAVLDANWRDQAVFQLLLKILKIFCEQPRFCRCLFESGLTSGLRKFLRKVRRGEVLQSWFEEMKAKSGGNSKSKSLRKAKEAVLAQKRVTEAIAEAEISCWQMLQGLAVNAGGGPEQTEQAHEKYRPDTSKTITQALQEMREATHGSQWPLAVKYLEEMLLYDFGAHAEFFHQQEGLILTMAELPNGQVASIHPLLVAILRLHVRSIPNAPHYCSAADDREEAMQRCDSYPRPQDLESKPMFPRLKQLDKRCSAPELAIEGELVMHSDKLTNDAKAAFADSGAVPGLLESLMDVRDLDLQDGLLRILSDLVQDQNLNADKAAKEFKEFVLMDNGGAEVVLELMKGHLKNQRRVAAALYTLAGVIALIPDSAASMATEFGSKVLIQTVWKYWNCPDTRRRTLMLLRRMRDANPDLTAFMLKHWKANLVAWENDEDLAATDTEVTEAEPLVSEAATEREPDEAASAPQVEGAEAGDDGALATPVVAPTLNEENPRETHLDEETLNEALNVEDGRPDSRASLAGAGPPSKTVTVEMPPQRADEVAGGTKSEANLPREMRHFLALLRVYRFEQKSSILAIPDVVKAIVDFKDDTELSRLGMRALMSGTAMEQEMRLPTIGRCPNFVRSMRRIMQKESLQDALQLQLRLVLGILDNDPTDYQDWVECAVLAVAKVLQATMLWTTNSWEVILQALEEAIRTPQGKILLQNFNVALSVYKEWEKLKDAHDDALAKMIVSSFHDQTERILEIIG